MSKERDLLGRWYNGDLLPEEYMKLMKETKELLAQPEPLSFDDLNNMLGEAEELLAQPEPEPIEDRIARWHRLGYEQGKKAQREQESEQEPVVLQYRTKPNWTGNWSKWEDCRKEAYEDYIRVPILHDWTYEVRELYTSPPKREPLSDEQKRLAAIAIKQREAHGIGGGE